MHAESQAILRDSVSEIWDADDGMPLEHVLGSPLGQATRLIHEDDRTTLKWVCYFVARRALACWDLSCEDSRPRNMVRVIGRHLADPDVSLDDLCELIRSPHSDCRYSDTQGAADSVAHAARYLRGESLPDAIYCISGADLAYDHVLTEDGFREWLIEVAIPVASEHREMTFDERFAKRTSGFGLEATHWEPTIGEQDGAGQPPTRTEFE